MKQMQSLEHHFLIAMPSLDDSWFEKTVIYIVEDNEHGTMGLVINLPHKLSIQELLEHFDYTPEEAYPFLSQQVMMGGPVDMERGFILHHPLGNWKSSMSLDENLAMTVSDDLLQALAQDQGPEQFVVCLGFAGWKPGQLAQEIQANSWLTIPYNQTLLFDTDTEEKWEVALGTLGISPEFLTAEAGNA
ncbi:MAG: YqgE/AlgH family protein [Thiomicrorhabdus chilensis]|uniref:YqgE/AlgH family protein n=1 Tax=Thiomicrorhabdus chilensis TaxID=63656 RepID=UPI00299D1872|nr:YqgE/AlgH family protein [Thiomicrorhabdus chilensis]MDX1347753.1 YqgE/AlgH family protein [Thiomicrorhabdus chilensis]